LSRLSIVSVLPIDQLPVGDLTPQTWQISTQDSEQSIANPLSVCAISCVIVVMCAVSIGRRSM
jgi:hypothetical protein